jgi:hypothetical protein
VNGSLVEFDWPKLRDELASLKLKLTEQIIAHAEREGVFFNQPEPEAH